MTPPDPTRTTRRGFLKKGLLGTAAFAGLAAAGALGLSLWPTRRAFVPRRELRVLDATELAILAEVTATTAPTADPVEVAHRVDEMLTDMPPIAQRDLRRLLRFVESGVLGVLFEGRARPFSQLSAQGKIAALSSMRDSRLALRRAGYQVLRRLTLSAHYANPSSWAELGYLGPPTLVAPT